MATTIKLKNGSGAPLSGDLVQGEPALDLTNKRLYTEDSGGSVIEVGTNPSTLTVDGDLAVDTDTLFVDVSTGNVGIGTDSPAALLNVGTTDVLGDVTLAKFSASASNLRATIDFTNHVNTAVWSTIGSPEPNEFYIATAGTERLRIDASGNVGIGTDSPQDFLHVSGGGAGTFGRIRITGQTNETIQNNIYGDTSGNLIFQADQGNAAASSTMRFSVDGSEAMRIASSGNVGIGETAPATPLHITSPDSNPPIIRLELNDSSVAAGAETGGIEWYANDASTGGTGISAQIKCVEDNGFGTSYGLQFYTSTVSGGILTETPAMRIDEIGRVGIGTSSPLGTLDISQGSALGLVLGANNGLQIRTNAAVKVGRISTPSYDTSIAPFGVISGVSSSTENSIEIGNNTGTLSKSNSIKFYTASGQEVGISTERALIDSSGNVGIGTSNPAEKLTIAAGATDRAGFRISGATATLVLGNQNSGAGTSEIKYDRGSNALTFSNGITGSLSERMRIDASGNVGIGWSVPDCPLFVTNGDIGTTGSRLVARFFSYSATGTRDRGLEIYNGINSGRVNASVTYNAESGGSTGQHIWQTDGAERMRLDSSGNLLVGTTSTPSGSTSGAALMANNQIIASRTSAAALALYRPDSNGDVALFHKGVTQVGSISVTGVGTAYNTSSDQRLKENIVDAPAGNIDAIRVRSFDWKADGSHQTYGMVAQELVDVAPEAVSQGATEDDMWGVDYSKLVPMLVKEIQDLRARVAQLEEA